MTAWTSDELTKIGTAEELELAPLRRDGTLQRPVPVWVVRLGDDLYVRSVNGRSAGWFRVRPMISPEARAAAVAFTREGASVVVMSRSEGRNQDTVSGDVSRSVDVQQALQKTIETFGRLDFAFKSAGIEQPVAALVDITEEDWTHLINIDLVGVFLCMKYQIPLLQQQGGGVIVNTSSGAGVKGFKGQVAYCAAKFGVKRRISGRNVLRSRSDGRAVLLAA